MTDTSHAPGDLALHSAFVRRLARSLVRDVHAAEDVAQETLRRALEGPPARGTRAWLARVTRSLAHRRWRGDVRRAERERRSARAEALPSAAHDVVRAEILQRVVTAVRGLDEPYRATVLARFYEDLSPAAIARRHGVPVETVRTRLKRGLVRLRETLGREDGDWRASLGLLVGLPDAADSASAVPAALAAPAALAKLVAPWAAAVAFAWWLLASGPGADERDLVAGAVPDGAARAAVLETPSRPAAPRVPLAGGPAPAPRVSGRVLDEHGRPVAGASVHVLAREEPFPAGGPDAIGWNDLVGRTFPCDGDGRYEVELEAVRTVFVVPQSSPALEPEVPGAGEGRWVEAPRDDVDFVVRRRPTGVVEVVVLEGATRRPLDDFRVAVHGIVEELPQGGRSYRGFSTRAANDGLCRMEWRVEDPGGLRLSVNLTEPEVGGLWARITGGTRQLRREILLLPGAVERVVFVLPERGVVRGQVVDGDGQPVESALVFFGPDTRARGDEPFRPLRAERVPDAVRTGADGWYELRGEGDEVTAAHHGHSPATVPVDASGLIRLGALATLRGRLLDAGRPLADVELRLDRRDDGPSSKTDAAGGFTFKSLHAGAHALWLEGELLAGVRLAAGEEREVELERPRGGALRIDLADGSALAPGAARGLLIGLDRVFGLHEVGPGPTPSSLVTQGAVRPGRYWLVNRGGLAGHLTVRPYDERVTLDAGACELTLRSGARRPVQVVPAHADAFTGLAAARAYVMLGEGEELVLRLAPGRYRVVTEAGAPLAEVAVTTDGASLDL